jgi:hypothetical protein
MRAYMFTGTAREQRQQRTIHTKPYRTAGGWVTLLFLLVYLLVFSAVTLYRTAAAALA